MKSTGYLSGNRNGYQFQHGFASSRIRVSRQANFKIAHENHEVENWSTWAFIEESNKSRLR